MERARFQGLQTRGTRVPAAVSEIPACGGTSDVRRVFQAPSGVLDAPVVVESSGSGSIPVAANWDLDFWRREYGNWIWQCRARTPVFQGDADDGSEAVAMSASVADYIDYALLLQLEDPSLR